MKVFNPFRLRAGIAGLMSLAAMAWTPAAESAVTLTGTSYTETFDSLPTSGGNGNAWTNDSTLPGWSLFTKNLSPFPRISAGTGSSTTGDFYSFGLSDDTDRALGGIASGNAIFGSPATGTLAGYFAAQLTNGTTSPFNSFTVSFDGEQWRNGGGTGLPQSMVFEYGFGSSFESVSGWTAPGGTFDFTSPTFSATASALDGNAAENRAAGLGGTISSLAWQPGESLWVRWIENNDASNDHGLAIDNFSITTTQEGGGGGDNPAGDFNDDGVVNLADYTMWRDNLGGEPGVLLNDTFGGFIGDGQYQLWKDNFGAGTPMLAAGGTQSVPEPAALTVVVMTVITGLALQSRRLCKR